ncbi:hypothetical protein GCM10025868_35190 [Angustibacter aerolatus]|uniref:Uncharacterized protein n=1 Tax=Angustibacter aerolatus TaxID=1162965 RepID=A0ABQ6JLQ5_9ACTN|nr:hypothetical protein [Angustibacter aerolatus]GMA88269.1 hypothetical protein GCM10025868_35190 [Angustibacter aerolatus]
MSLLVAGDTVLQVVDPGVEGADAGPSAADLGVDVNRPPRLLPPPRERVFTLPKDPGALAKRPMPWVMVLAPMAMAIPMALLVNPRFLFMAFMTPLMAVANYVSQRRSGARDHKEKVAQYEQDLADVEGRIERGLLAERDDRRALGPDPAEVLLTALAPGRRLWERRRSDPDHLVWRLGLADLPSQAHRQAARVARQQRRATTPRTLREVPAGLDLKQAGRARPRRAARDAGRAGPLAHRPDRGAAEPARRAGSCCSPTPPPRTAGVGCAGCRTRGSTASGSVRWSAPSRSRSAGGSASLTQAGGAAARGTTEHRLGGHLAPARARPRGGARRRPPAARAARGRAGCATGPASACTCSASTTRCGSCPRSAAG